VTIIAVANSFLAFDRLRKSALIGNVHISGWRSKVPEPTARSQLVASFQQIDVASPWAHTASRFFFDLLDDLCA
jgi:hypothetical protein